MKIELHILQNFAPSCLNRDDTNSPKDCVFGGVQRARISSQCLKRSIRMSPEFQPVVEGVEGIRTKGLLRELRTSLVDL
ncbi:MAG: type I-E CRISPR-associated protein Cas7/Cse4/CasC, partial [Firmicutes bacterium]|nr:type I-E CRISPR-associated protein Cas7/Cse4/CasC [Bacillota bacterium]